MLLFKNFIKITLRLMHIITLKIVFLLQELYQPIAISIIYNIYVYTYINIFKPFLAICSVPRWHHQPQNGLG